MAEPKKETVRIALPPRPDAQPDPQNGGGKRDTARIVLPSRTPVVPPRRSPPTITPSAAVSAEPAAESPVISLRRPPVQPPTGASPMLQPLPKPAASENFTGVPVQPGPKKETARITVLPKPAPAPKPAVNMTKTQPLILRPAAVVQPAPVVVVPSRATDPFDSIPRWLCWGVLGISALIFFIQIWNYAVS